MIETHFLLISFLYGVGAFFAPCAVALLPGYISAFLTRNVEKENLTKKRLLVRALNFGGLSILGIATVYASIGTLLFLIASIVKPYLPYIVLVLGVATIVLGIMMLLGKNVSLPLHGPQKNVRNQYVEAYIFGLAYGISALGCLFPFFLVTLTIAISAGVLGSLYVVAYGVGMSLFMLLFYILAVVAKQYLQKNISKIMPYISTIGGIAVVLAGIYLIYYQWVFL